MPEYLSPGVYIEEIPSRFKAIEGVSTSTAGIVGRSERGPVAGFPLPFAPAATANVTLPRDEAPTLVTSYGEFARLFGAPSDRPDAAGYMPHAVRAFFDNGGRRIFVSRVVPLPSGAGTGGATRAALTLAQGARLRLARRAEPGQPVYFTSIRGLRVGADVEFRRASDNSVIVTRAVTGTDPLAGSVTLGTALAAALEPNEVYAVPAGLALTATGPRIHARNPGAWGADLRVLVSNSDRPATALRAAAAAGDRMLQVQSASSFYPGAIVEVETTPSPTTKAREYFACVRIHSGNRVEIAGPGLANAAIVGAPIRVVEIDFTIVDSRTGAIETFRGLTWNGDTDLEVRRRHYSTVINARSRLVYVQPPGVGGLTGSEDADIDTQPMTANGFEAGPTADLGDDGTNAIDYVGVDMGPGTRTAIQSLQDVDDIRILGCPESTARAVQEALISQCERMRYRFAVLDADPAPGAPVVNRLLAHRNAYDSSFAGYYGPWVQIVSGDRMIDLPPCGHVMGIFARTDNERGVWKAPANEVVRGITGLTTYVTTGEQDVLNPRGVNAIRRFEGRGTRVWGARTLSSDPELRYVNVRRYLIFLEASIDRSTQWVVFEPNGPDTWARVTDSVAAFLHTQWRAGALMGRKPEDAYYVRCDETTMTADDTQNGRLICELGVAIVRPAEFVIFRIEQLTGFGRAS